MSENVSMSPKANLLITIIGKSHWEVLLFKDIFACPKTLPRIWPLSSLN